MSAGTRSRRQPLVAVSRRDAIHAGARDRGARGHRLAGCAAVLHGTQQAPRPGLPRGRDSTSSGPGAMRVLVTGATGLIGAAVVARLLAAGHEVVAIARNVTRSRRQRPGRRLDRARHCRRDPARGLAAHALRAIDAVVNCAGVLQDNARDSTRGVHVDGIGALFAACERGRRAAGRADFRDRRRPRRTTAFSRTKQRRRRSADGGATSTG